MLNGRGRILLPLIVLAIIAPVLGLGHIRFHAARSRLPETGRHEARLGGLADPVEIAMDERGIPHIDARAASDLWFAQGYVHARDRFFQMELGRRKAAGRLSEIFGETTLASDRTMRTLRIAATARRQATDLDEPTRAVLERYADGVNAALKQYGRWVAPELWMLGVKPLRWTVEDSLSIGLLLELQSTWAMGEEIKRSVEMAHLGRETALGLWGWTPRDARRWIPPVKFPGRPPGDGDAILPPFMGGSNNWAIAPQRTATGRPLLANDPHLGVSVPGTWYAVDLRAPGIHVAGVSIAGIPGVLIGHNGRVAWGMTMSMMDDQDLYVLTPDADRTRELIDGAWIPLRTIAETIDVRWRREPETLTVRVSRHGPIVRDTFDSTLALAWTAYEGPSALEAFLRMARADDVEAVAAAWTDVPSPSMNLVAADVDGHILHQVVGRRPRRLRGAGRLPAPGSDSAWMWKGLVEFDRNPRVLDPKEGWVATANHDLFGEGDFDRRETFPGDFAPPWRVRRIRSRLAAETGWDVGKCLGLQGDLRSGRAVAVLKALWPDLERHDGPTARALLGWDGRMEADRPEPLLYSRLVLELVREIGRDEAVEHGLERPIFDAERVLRLLAGGLPDRWWDDVRTERIEDRDLIVSRCLDRVDASGPSPENWGKVHRVDFSHPLRDMPVIGSLLACANPRAPIGLPGDGTTLDVSCWDPDRPYDVTVIPSMRFVADVGDWDRSILVLPLGQSGRPWSSHVVDQLGDWLGVRGRTLPFSREAVEARTRAVLELLPRGRDDVPPPDPQ